MNLTALDWSILGPAWLAGLLVLATHVPLGQHVLARGIIFVDLAIAQLAGLGVIAASALGWQAHGWQTQFAAVSAAVLGALLLNWSEKRWPQVQEALIGVLFVLAATGAMVLVSNDPHGGEQLKNLLVGQILWVLPGDLVPVALLYAGVLILWFGARERLGSLGFYILFAITVTASVQLVGVYLVFASLIIPALATRGYAPSKDGQVLRAQDAQEQPPSKDGQVPRAVAPGILPSATLMHPCTSQDAQERPPCRERPQGTVRLAVGYALGGAGYSVGLVLSTFFDLPAGAIIVWILALLGMLIAFIRSYQPAS